MKNKRIKRAILCIDMQQDFTKPSGSLFVNGAMEDVENVAKMIKDKGRFFTEIIFTMDTHNNGHISFCDNWVKKVEGECGDVIYEKSLPFSVVYKDRLEDGRDSCTNKNITKEHTLKYIDTLNDKGSLMMLWPKHCVFNTRGWDIDTTITSVVNNSPIKQSFFNKGCSDLTEFYSAVEPDMVIEGDVHAQVNTELLDKLSLFDEIYVCGEAMDYCVVNTLLSIVKHKQELAKRIIILADCMSPITPRGDVSEYFDFITDNGGKVVLSTNI